MPQFLQYALPLAGLGTNIYGGIESAELSATQKAAMENALSYMQNPAKFAALVNSLTSSLWGEESGAITPAVTRAVEGTLGGAGLGESPGMVAYAISQGLAPYITSIGQTAATEAGNLIRPGLGGTPSFGGVNLSQLASMYPWFAKALGMKTPGSTDTDTGDGGDAWSTLQDILWSGSPGVSYTDLTGGGTGGMEG